MKGKVLTFEFSIFKKYVQKNATNFVIVKADKKDRKEVTRLMMEVFFKTDPASIYTKVAENPNLSSAMQEISIDSLDEGVSFLAKEKENSKSIAGMVLNGIRPTTLPPSYMKSAMRKVSSESERNLLELWAFVSMMPPESEKFFEGEKQVFEIIYLVVDESQRNKGIATALVKRSLKEAADKGFKFVRIDCTSHFTARIASALGLTCIYQINYLDYRNSKGEQVFKKVILPHDKILVYSGKINS